MSGDAWSTITVLQVDDDAELLDLASTFLERQDDSVEVETETDPETALERVRDECIDCIVSDYRMPEIDGLELLDAVREVDPSMPFILFTGHGSESIASEAISAGVTDYLQKETSTDQYTILANKIREAVAHARAEEALRESEERYRTLVEQSHDGIYIYQGDEFVFVNDRTAEIAGYSPGELDGMAIWELLHPDDVEYVRSIAERRARGEDAPNTYETRIVRPDGETRHLELSVREITYDGERAVLGSARDVTGRKFQQRAIERQRDLLSSFRTGVVHDLRDGINVVAGRVQRADLDPEDAEAIDRATDRLTKLVDGMVALVSYAGPVEERREISLATAVERAWSDVDAPEASLSIETDRTVEASPTHLGAILNRLIENAVVHGGDEVTVTVGQTDGGFFVADDGPGVPESERESVFDQGYSTVEDRLGYGLTVVEYAARAHGWAVSVEASGDGGAKFVVGLDASVD